MRSFAALALLVSIAAGCGAAAPHARSTATPSRPATTSPMASVAERAPPVEAPAQKGAPELAAIRTARTLETDAAVPIAPDDPVWGDRDALVTIVWFGDFQCPFTGKSEKTIEQIKERYGASRVRVVWKNEPLPFHPRAMPAARAALAVLAAGGAQAFWAFHHDAFTHQRDLRDADLERMARNAGVDEAHFREALRSPAIDARIAADQALATRLKVLGTPVFFINGTHLSGARHFDVMKGILDEEERKAAVLVAQGTPRDRVYVAMANDNVRHRPQESAPEPETHEDTTTVWKVPLGSAPTRGPATALVTIVEFADFQCPFCKRVETTLDQLRGEYGTKLRIVWRNEPLPFHPHAEPAAELALEARKEKGDLGFWAVHDALFVAQPHLEDADLDAIATQAGLDLAAVHRAIQSKAYARAIEEDSALSDEVNATGTPHFFINGRRLVGAQPVEKFRAIIDEEIAHATNALARGADPNRLYDALIANGREPPPPDMKNIPGVAQNAPSRGPANAKVTIVEFADFQCPFCERAEPTLARVMNDYAGKVRIVWRNLPLPMHPDAALAARAAMEAYAQKGNDGFWKMHDLLFAANGADGLKRPALDDDARQIGLDLTRWGVALDAGAHQAEVDADAALATRNGIRGTPLFLVNGYVVNGAQPYTKFRRIIDRALSEAR